MGVLNGLILIFVRPLVGIYELSGETMELSIILALSLIHIYSFASGKPSSFEVQWGQRTAGCERERSA